MQPSEHQSVVDFIRDFCQPCAAPEFDIEPISRNDELSMDKVGLDEELSQQSAPYNSKHSTVVGRCFDVLEAKVDAAINGPIAENAWYAVSSLATSLSRLPAMDVMLPGLSNLILKLSPLKVGNCQVILLLSCDDTLHVRCTHVKLLANSDLILLLEYSVILPAQVSVNYICEFFNQVESNIRPIVDPYHSLYLDYMHAQVKPAQRRSIDQILPPGLSATLLPFQQNTVSWLLFREGLGDDFSVHDPALLPLKLAGVRISDLQNTMTLNPGDQLDLPRTGGILAEEMGLGKTLEILSLILLNKASVQYLKNSVDKAMIKSGCTLIVSPNSILRQWADEIERHAPDLRVLIYEGTSNFRMNSDEIAAFDVVLASFEVLRTEFKYAQADHPRSRRFERQYKRKDSPLTEICFWRVCVDEAQVIESTNSAAYEMCSLIPRVYTWAVTGTPVGSHKSPDNDIKGLIQFLGYLPWFYKIKSIPASFVSFMKAIMIRNTKEQVQNELLIPKQHQNVIYLQLDTVEGEFYYDLQKKCVNEVGYGLDGLSDRMSEASLSKWLLQLRQTCCHPQIGDRNQRLLGTTFKSIPEVLKMMQEQARSNVYSTHRKKLSFDIRCGLIHELGKKWDNARIVYEKVLADVIPRVNALRQEVKSSLTDTTEQVVDVADESDDSPNSVQARLTSWLSLYHQVMFCLASVYLEMKQKQESDKYYAAAETVRNELLGSRQAHVEAVSQEFKVLQNELDADRMLSDKMFQIPQTEFEGGILSSPILDQVRIVSKWLNRNAKQIKVYRKGVLEALASDLHTDYSKDAALQDYGHECQTLYFNAVIHRRQVLLGIVITGQVRNVDRQQQDGYLAVAKNGKRTFIADDADNKEDDVIPPPGPIVPPPKILLKTLVSELKRFFQGIGTNRHEIEICKREHVRLSEILKQHVEIVTLADREISGLIRVWNARVLFYRSLQKLSDAVAIPEDIYNPDEAFVEASISANTVQHNLSLVEARYRYLENLKSQEEDHNAGNSSCHICQNDFDGTRSVSVTACGHMFCSACLTAWFKVKKSCPTCTHRLNPNGDVKVVSFEQVKDVSRSKMLPQEVAPAHLVFPPHHKLPHIIGSFGTKVTMIMKHIKFLMDRDPVGFKCLVFSQWDEVLDLMLRGLEQNNIGHIRFMSNKDKSKAPILFKTDPKLKVFLLNARSQSSGLTLVCANHVFIMEPIVNPAIILQAMGRVHRLGQTRETYVHHYVAQDTVEDLVYQLSEQRKINFDDSSNFGQKTTRKTGEVVQTRETCQILYTDVCRQADLKEAVTLKIQARDREKEESEKKSKRLASGPLTNKRKSKPQRRAGDQHTI